MDVSIPIVVKDWLGQWQLGLYVGSLEEVEIACAQAFKDGCKLLGVHLHIPQTLGR